MEDWETDALIFSDIAIMFLTAHAPAARRMPGAGSSFSTHSVDSFVSACAA
jgi:hypothetical protein